MAFELVSNCRPNEISPVGVKTVLHHQVDVAKIDVAEVDRDFLGVTWLRSQLMHIFGHHHHPLAICMDGIWMVTSGRQGTCFALSAAREGLQRPELPRSGT